MAGDERTFEAGRRRGSRAEVGSRGTGAPLVSNRLVSANSVVVASHLLTTELLQQRMVMGVDDDLLSHVLYPNIDI